MATMQANNKRRTDVCPVLLIVKHVRVMMNLFQIHLNIVYLVNLI
jgi:hypothetical protein